MGPVLAPWGVSLSSWATLTWFTRREPPLRRLQSGRWVQWERQSGSLPPPSERSGEWPRPKSLALIPQLYATSLAYGRNLLTGQSSPAGQWLVRNMVVWHRPNPAVGALGTSTGLPRATSRLRRVARSGGLTCRRYGRNPSVSLSDFCRLRVRPRRTFRPRWPQDLRHPKQSL